mmetsp:Transcript_26617/g.44499  ORF Transcript_26617/g.44499 Transcript_26617/m.44499 type:complete len:583 (+) Transcript_26617:40-1788(+)
MADAFGNARGSDLDNEPPFSRIFIICPKTLTEQNLQEAFERFGTIEYCRAIKDRATGEPKGVCYIKYDRASSAAEAIECMNGFKLSDDTGPLKVIIAEARGSAKPPPQPESTDREDNPPRSRLFLILPKSTPEADLTEKLRAFPDFEFSRMVRDKGAAFAKYAKASSAAKVLEEINANGSLDGLKIIKAVFAEPKSRARQPDRQERVGREYDRMMYNGGGPGQRSSSLEPPRSPLLPPPSAYSQNVLPTPGRGYPNSGGGGGPQNSGLESLLAALTPQLAMSNNPQLALAAQLIASATQQQQSGGGPNMGQGGQGPPPPPPSQGQQSMVSRQRLFVVVHKSVNADHLARLFARFPGMEYCDLKKDRATGESKGFAYINYSTPHAAAMAQQSLDNTDFPAGHRLKVMFAKPLGADKFAPEGFSASQSDELAISNSLAQMMFNGPSQSGGLQGPMGLPLVPSPPPLPLRSRRDGGGGGVTAEGGILPAPGVGGSADTESRLFIVMGKPVAEALLYELFSRFGQVEYVRLQHGKNYGYVKYTNAGAAKTAVDCLNGAEAYGQVMKVMIAEPPSARDSRKRQRSDE